MLFGWRLPTLLALIFGLAGSIPVQALEVPLLGSLCENSLSHQTMDQLWKFVRSVNRDEVLRERDKIDRELIEVERQDREYRSDPRRFLAEREEIRQLGVEKFGASWYARAQSQVQNNESKAEDRELLRIFARFLAADLRRMAFERSMAQSEVVMETLKMKRLVFIVALYNEQEAPPYDVFLADLKSRQAQVDIADRDFQEVDRSFVQVQNFLFAFVCSHRDLARDVYSIAGSQLLGLEQCGR